MSRTVGVVFSDEQAKYLQEKADEQGMTISAYIRKSLEGYRIILQRLEQKREKGNGVKKY